MKHRRKFGGRLRCGSRHAHVIGTIEIFNVIGIHGNVEGICNGCRLLVCGLLDDE